MIDETPSTPNQEAAATKTQQWQLQQISKIAVKLARQDILRLAGEEGLTPSRIMKAIAEALEAKETRTFKTKDDEIIYSEAMIDHASRLKAAMLGVDIWGLRDPDTTQQAQQVNFKINLSGKEIKTDEK